MHLFSRQSILTIWRRAVATAAPVLLLAGLGGVATAQAQAPGQGMQFGTALDVPAPVIRVYDDMRHADLSLGAAVQGEVQMPFRPTVDGFTFQQLKTDAAAQRAKSKGRPALGRNEVAALAPPNPIGAGFEGLNQTQSGGLRPPDTHGAAGNSAFCEIVNTRLGCFTKAAPNSKFVDVSLAAFFGYTLQTLFDPRIVYDRDWDRWVATAEAFPESATVQRQFIAVSQTDNPAGAWWIYGVDVNIFDNDDFWDYPQLGMDQDAIIITANIFGPVSYRESRMIAVAKARLYNGLGWSVPVWTGLAGTLAPPIVLDQNPNSYLVAAPAGGSAITKYTLLNSGRAFGQSLSASVITVPAYTVPPNAQQPGTTAVLDTLDARFVNASIQVGDSLFQAHTTGAYGLPTPKWYEFDTEGAGADTIKQSSYFWTASVSNDFNISIAANAPGGDVFVVWTSTDPSTGTQAQVRASGKESTDANTFFGPGQALFTSPTSYTGFRWGDYSAVSLDPLNPRRAWVVNEKINSTSVWGSWIGQVGW